MTTITIITIVVIALLTVIIFGLTGLAYSSCIKTYRLEVENGIHDIQIKEDLNKKESKGGLVGKVISSIIFSLFIVLFIYGIVYKASGETFIAGGYNALVIKSESMSEFYNEKDKETYNEDLQFDIGDICIFEPCTTLTIGEVYAYKYKDILITHRLVGIEENTETVDNEVVTIISYIFKGDYNPSNDSQYVTSDQILYHYTGNKIIGIGAFILYAQSYFGIWSLFGIIGITISSEITLSKIEKINKKRNEYLEEQRWLKELSETDS